MSEDGLGLAVQRLDQAVKMLTDERDAIHDERAVLKEVVQTMLSHLDHLEENFARTESMVAAAGRMEQELRETVASSHKLIDKMPGKRHY